MSLTAKLKWSALAAALFLAIGVSAFAIAEESSNKVVTVEEDWEVVIGETNQRQASPQIATQMNHNSNNNADYAIFCINYQEYPKFVEGGLEIQLWEEDVVVEVDTKGGVTLNLSGETISWTQSMTVKEGKITFAIKNGKSETYGEFGGDGFSVSQNAQAGSLDSYVMASSLENSGAVLGKNRVTSMKLKEVRYYYSNGTVKTDTTGGTVISTAGDST